MSRNDQRQWDGHPQAIIDIFAAQEKQYEEEVKRLDVGEIPDSDLCLSPLVLPSKFLNEQVLASIDLYGSNVGLIDSEAESYLQTPNNSISLQFGKPFKGELTYPAVVSSDFTVRKEPVVDGEETSGSKVEEMDAGKNNPLEISDTSLGDQDDEEDMDEEASLPPSEKGDRRLIKEEEIHPEPVVTDEAFADPVD